MISIFSESNEEPAERGQEMEEEDENNKNQEMDLEERNDKSMNNKKNLQKEHQTGVTDSTLK